MLVLSRKKSERIVVGKNVVITIVDIGGKNVRIGVEAPKDVLILRGELAEDPDEPSSELVASK